MRFNCESDTSGVGQLAGVEFLLRDCGLPVLVAVDLKPWAVDRSLPLVSVLPAVAS